MRGCRSARSGAGPGGLPRARRAGECRDRPVASLRAGGWGGSVPRTPPPPPRPRRRRRARRGRPEPPRPARTVSRRRSGAVADGSSVFLRSPGRAGRGRRCGSEGRQPNRRSCRAPGVLWPPPVLAAGRSPLRPPPPPCPGGPASLLAG